MARERAGALAAAVFFAAAPVFVTRGLALAAFPFFEAAAVPFLEAFAAALLAFAASRASRCRFFDVGDADDADDAAVPLVLARAVVPDFDPVEREAAVRRRPAGAATAGPACRGALGLALPLRQVAVAADAVDLVLALRDAQAAADLARVGERPGEGDPVQAG